MLLKIAIIDDDAKDLELIQSIVSKHLLNYSQNFNLYTFTSPGSIDFQHEQYDLIFLDIEMPSIDGICLAEKISDISPRTKIIFVTNLDHMVFDATKVAPFGFIRKHRITFEIPEVLARLQKHFEKEKKYVVIKNNYEIYKIELKRIIWIEVIKNQILYHTTDGTFVDRNTLKCIYSSLPKNTFIKINKPYIINVEHIINTTKTEVILSDGTSLPMHSKMRRQIKEAIILSLERNLL